MRKVKLKLDYNIVQSLMRMLFDYAHNRKSRHNLERMAIGLCVMLQLRLQVKTIIVWSKKRSISFSIPEACAIVEALGTLSYPGDNLTEAHRMSLLLLIDPQLP